MKYLKKIARLTRRIKNALASGVAVAALLMIAVPTNAQTARFLSFLTKGPLFLPFAPAAQTSTNYSNLQGIELGTSYAGTNGFFYVDHYVQTNSTTYPPTSGYTPVYSQGNPFSDVLMWGNRDGTPAVCSFNISALNVAQAAGAATNIIKVTLFTLNRLSDSPGNALGPIYNNQGTPYQNQFAFTVTNVSAQTSGTGTSGYDQLTISTNIPSYILQGALGLMVQLNMGPVGTNAGTAAWTNIITGPYNAPVTNSVTGWQIQSMGISGFAPAASP